MTEEGQEPGGSVGFKSTWWREGVAAAAPLLGLVSAPRLEVRGAVLHASCRPGPVCIGRYLTGSSEVQWHPSIRRTFTEHLLCARQGPVG